MTKLYFSLIGMLLLSQIAISRPLAISDTETVKTEEVAVVKKGCAFNKGVFLENSDLIIPWGMSFKELVNVGNPTIVCSDGTRVTWYSITMFNGIPVKKMWCTFSKCYKKGTPQQKLNTLYLSIDSADIPRLKNYLDSISHHPMELAAGKKNYRYSCTIDNCKIFLGFAQYHDGFLWMQSKEYYR